MGRYNFKLKQIHLQNKFQMSTNKIKEARLNKMIQSNYFKA